MIYSTLEKELEEKEKHRLIKLSMLSIDKFPFELKLQLRNSLILKCYLVGEWKTKKKRRIMMKRETFASGKL